MEDEARAWYTRLKYLGTRFAEDLQKEEAPSPSRVHAGLLVLLLVSSGFALPLYAFGSTVGAAAVHMEIASPGIASPPAMAAGQPGPVIEVRTETGHFVSADGVVTVSQVEILVIVPQPAALGGAVWTGGPGAIVIHEGDGAYVVSSSPNGRMPMVVGIASAAGLGPAPGFQGPVMLRGMVGSGEPMFGALPYSSTNGLTAAIPEPWSDFSQRRSKFEIYVEILEVMKRGPMTPFEIAFYARLNHKRTREYTEFLAGNGYLQAVTEDGRMVYVLTKEGAGFMEGVRSLFLRTKLIEVANYSYQRDF